MYTLQRFCEVIKFAIQSEKITAPLIPRLAFPKTVN